MVFLFSAIFEICYVASTDFKVFMLDEGLILCVALHWWVGWFKISWKCIICCYFLKHVSPPFIYYNVGKFLSSTFIPSMESISNPTVKVIEIIVDPLDLQEG